MYGQNCVNCGYYMAAGESVVANVGKVLGDLFGMKSPAQSAFGFNTVSNITKLKCPKCGEVGR